MAGNFQVSSKLNDGRIFVVAGENYNEFKVNLGSLLGDIDAETMLTTMAASFVGQSIPAPTQTHTNVNDAISAAFPGSSIVNPTPPGVASSPAGRECKHGFMTKREGSGAKGPWKAYMCPSPKGTPDQCSPDFIKRGTPEWNNF